MRVCAFRGYRGVSVCSRGGRGDVRLLILGWSLKRTGELAVGAEDAAAGGTSTCSVSDSPNFTGS